MFSEKRFLRSLALIPAAVALSLASGAVAQSQAGSASAPAGRIGFVDLDRITSKAKQQAATMDNVSGEVRRIQQDVQAKIDKMRDLEREIQKSEGVISADEVSRKRKEVNNLKNELDDLEVKYKRQMQRLDETVFEPLVKKIGYAIEDVAKEKNFDIVLRGEAVFYGNPAVDLTEDVIKRLDLKSDGTTSGSSTRSASRAASKETAKETPEPAATPSSDKESKAAPKAAPRVRPVDRQQDQ